MHARKVLFVYGICIVSGICIVLIHSEHEMKRYCWNKNGASTTYNSKNVIPIIISEISH